MAPYDAHDDDWVPTRLSVPFNYAAGRAGSRFLLALQEEGRILTARCQTCAKTLVPLRSFCPYCHQELTETVPVGPGGVLAGFTVVYHRAAHYPRESPLVYGLIRLDGADTLFVHLVAGVAPDAVCRGLRVEACFDPLAATPLLAVTHFQPGGAEHG